MNGLFWWVARFPRARAPLSLVPKLCLGTPFREALLRGQYQAWQEGSHPEQIQDLDMMRQKIEYIHNNPVERGHVDEPVHWRCSSGRGYFGRPGLIEVVTDWW